MEPVIRNSKAGLTPESNVVRLVSADDSPPTYTMMYQEIAPDQTSTHHIHPWEHEVFIIEGSGTLICDGKEYPVQAGDGILIPGNVDHITINNGGQGTIRRLEVNPLIAAQGGAGAGGTIGSGQPPVIKNIKEYSGGPGLRLIGSGDGAPNYFMSYGVVQAGQATHDDTGGHTHTWEHEEFVLEGSGEIICGDQEFPVMAGDGVYMPPNLNHSWRNSGQGPLSRVSFNPLAAEQG